MVFGAQGSTSGIFANASIDTGPSDSANSGHATRYDLRHPEGLATIERLIDDADVVIENSNPARWKTWGSVMRCSAPVIRDWSWAASTPSAPTGR
jgi:hypothetical protein